MVMDRGCVIAKKEVLYLGLFGLACWLWGTVFINRRNVEESRRVLNDTAESIRSEKVISLRFSALLIAVFYNIKRHINKIEFSSGGSLCFPKGIDIPTKRCFPSRRALSMSRSSRKCQFSPLSCLSTIS